MCVLCKQQLQSFQECALYYLYLNFLFHRRWKLLHRSVLLIFSIEGLKHFISFLPQNNVIGIQHSEPQCSSGVPQQRHELELAPQGRPVSFVRSIKEHYFMKTNPEESHASPYSAIGKYSYGHDVHRHSVTVLETHRQATATSNNNLLRYHTV